MSLLQKLEKLLFIRSCTCFVSKSVLKAKEQMWKKAFYFLYCWVWVNISVWRLLYLLRNKFSSIRKERIVNSSQSCVTLVSSINTLQQIKQCRKLYKLKCPSNIRFTFIYIRCFIIKKDVYVDSTDRLYQNHFHSCCGNLSSAHNNCENHKLI